MAKIIQQSTISKLITMTTAMKIIFKNKSKLRITLNLQQFDVVNSEHNPKV